MLKEREKDFFSFRGLSVLLLVVLIADLDSRLLAPAHLSLGSLIAKPKLIKLLI